MHDSTRWDTRPTVTAYSDNVIAHAGAATLRLTADRTGLTQALSDALHRDDFTPDHDRGRPATADDPGMRVEYSVGEVAEITAWLPHLHTWPESLRVFVRRVKPLRETTPKPLKVIEQLALDLQSAASGWRYEAFATNHNIPPTPKETPARTGTTLGSTSSQSPNNRCTSSRVRGTRVMPAWDAAPTAHCRERKEANCPCSRHQ